MVIHRETQPIHERPHLLPQNSTNEIHGLNTLPYHAIASIYTRWIWPLATFAALRAAPVLFVWRPCLGAKDWITADLVAPVLLFQILSKSLHAKVLGRSCSKQHCSQRDLWQLHALGSQLPFRQKAKSQPKPERNLYGCVLDGAGPANVTLHLYFAVGQLAAVGLEVPLCHTICNFMSFWQLSTSLLILLLNTIIVNMAWHATSCDCITVFICFLFFHEPPFRWRHCHESSGCGWCTSKPPLNTSPDSKDLKTFHFSFHHLKTNSGSMHASCISLSMIITWSYLQYLNLSRYDVWYIIDLVNTWGHL